jgi:hypothetical protein
MGLFAVKYLVASWRNRQASMMEGSIWWTTPNPDTELQNISPHRSRSISTKRFSSNSDLVVSNMVPDDFVDFSATRQVVKGYASGTDSEGDEDEEVKDNIELV